MDRAEKIGLGTAVGGHLLLFAALSLGLLLSANPIKKPEALSVSLVAETADISAAPDAIQEEPAPMIAGENETPEPPAMQQIEKPLPKIIERDIKPSAKNVSKQAVPKQSPKQQPKPNQSKSAADNSGGFSKGFENAIKSASKTNGSGKAVGTLAAKTAAQYRSAANNAIGAEVKPFIPGCAPQTSDNSSLNVFVALQIGKSANLISADIYDVRGVTPANQAQVEPMKKCVLESLRRASPYNLETEGYDTWKSHRVQLKVNFK